MLLYSPDEKKQLNGRVPAHVVRRQIERFNNGECSCEEVCASLGVGRTRLYELRHEWLKDRDGFTPGASGGDRRGAWPAECERLALELISSGPVNFALVADELERCYGFARSRAAVRDYLSESYPLLAQRAKPGPKPYRRWQRSRAGEVWQHDSTPVRVWPAERPQALIVTVDDHTRKVVRASVFERETLWAHFTHLRLAFVCHGLPETVYTDGLNMFGREGEDAATKCGRMLLALGMAHRIAPTPQAKGKVERNIGTQQRRLVPVLRREGVRREGQCASVIGPLIDYWNAKRVNGTTRLTPDDAHALAQKEGRYVYRPCPSTALLDLHMAYHETRRVSPAHTIDFRGREWPISPTMRKTVGVVLHPDIKFWVIEHQPDPASPAWPNILACHSL